MSENFPIVFGLLGAAAFFPIFLIEVVVRRHRLFWSYLTFLLFGYLFFGKRFAYFGFEPLFVGEIGLLIGAGSLLIFLILGRVKVTGVFWRRGGLLLILFMGWQVLQTVPYLETYGLLSVRDAALWGYAAFAFFVYFIIPKEAVARFIRIYQFLIPFFLVWAIAACLLNKETSATSFVEVPSILNLKGGDVGVHLAGIGAFFLLRLDKFGRPWRNGHLWVLWLLWAGAWILYGTQNRGGMISALVGCLLVAALRSGARWDRPVFLGILCIFFLQFGTVTLPSTATGHREVSAKQIVENMVSIFGKSDGSLDNTRTWRLNWWRQIIDYTWNGEYFWTGKGYGINLADDDGYQVTSNQSLRSPHNAFMTLLARSGVPGLTLWLLFLANLFRPLAILLLTRRRLFSDPASDESRYSQYGVWVLVYAFAAVFNSLFDVFLEGPMGGIWFWCLVGFAFVVRERVTSNEAVRPVPA